MKRAAFTASLESADAQKAQLMADLAWEKRVGDYRVTVEVYHLPHNIPKIVAIGPDNREVSLKDATPEVSAAVTDAKFVVRAWFHDGGPWLTEKVS